MLVIMETERGRRHDLNLLLLFYVVCIKNMSVEFKKVSQCFHSPLNVIFVPADAELLSRTQHCVQFPAGINCGQYKGYGFRQGQCAVQDE